MNGSKNYEERGENSKMREISCVCVLSVNCSLVPAAAEADRRDARAPALVEWQEDIENVIVTELLL